MHGTLPHDFLNNNDLLLSRSSELIKGLRIDKKTFLRLLQCLTDLFGNDIRCRMRCQGTRTLHIGLFFNRHIGLDEDFSLIRASGTSPHNIFIKIAFRRSEFSDLYPVGVRSGNHHDHAVQDSGCSASKLFIPLFCRNRLYIHDGVGKAVVLLRRDNIQLQLLHKFLRSCSFFFDSLSYEKDCSIQFCFGTAPYLRNLIMLSDKRTDKNFLFFFLFLCVFPVLGR